MVIAVLALVGAWGGTAVAAGLIGSSDIRDRSLRGRDVRSNTLTGRVVSGLSGRDIRRDSLDGTNIDESTLAEVPRAAGAGVAESLTGARVSRVLYARMVDAETVTVLDAGGLKLQARCTGDGELAVEALPSNSNGGVLHISATRPASNTAVTSVATDNDLRGGDVVNVLPAGADNTTGTLAWYAPSGDTITIDYLGQDGLGTGRGYQCLFAGTAVHGTA